MGRFTNPRDLYFGEGARHEVKNLKGSKAIIVSGGGSMRRGGFLQDIQKDLEDAGFEVKLFEGGDATLGARKAILEEEREKVRERMAEMQAGLDRLDYKIAHYEDLIVKAEQKIAGEPE